MTSASDSAEKDLDSSGVAGSEPNGPPSQNSAKELFLKVLLHWNQWSLFTSQAKIWFKSEKLSQTFRVSESPCPPPPPPSLSLSEALSPSLFLSSSSCSLGIPRRKRKNSSFPSFGRLLKQTLFNFPQIYLDMQITVHSQTRFFFFLKVLQSQQSQGFANVASWMRTWLFIYRGIKCFFFLVHIHSILNSLLVFF